MCISIDYILDILSWIDKCSRVYFLFSLDKLQSHQELDGQHRTGQARKLYSRKWGNIQVVKCLNPADVEAHDEVDVGSVAWAHDDDVDEGGSEPGGAVFIE